MADNSLLDRHEADEIHARLKAAIEIEKRACLWTPADEIAFVPALLPIFYGDGRALYWISTLNQRPRYHVIRGDSGWEVGLDGGEVPDDAPEFVDLIDDIIPDLEDEFGRARCSYCGASASVYANGPPEEANCGNANCERPDDVEAGCGWPALDDEGGCSWGRLEWPSGFATAKHPWAWHGNLLAEVS